MNAFSTTSSTFYKATTDRTSGANSRTSSRVDKGQQSDETQGFDEVLDKQVENKKDGASDRKSSSSKSSASARAAVDQAINGNTTVTPTIAMITPTVADAVNIAPVIEMPNVDPAEISSDTEVKDTVDSILGEESKDSVEENGKVSSDGATEQMLAGKGTTSQDTTPKTQSQSETQTPVLNSKSTFENHLSAYTSPTESEGDVQGLNSISQGTSYLQQKLISQLATTETEKPAKDDAAPEQKDVVSAKDAKTETTTQSQSPNVSQSVKWESLSKEPVHQKEVVQLIEKALNSTETTLPRRVEIPLQTPEGATVRLFLQESGGNVRAQLSTNDSETLKWLNQQIPALKEMQTDSSVRWLPPQMESQSQDSQQKGFFSQQNQQQDGKESSSDSQKKDEEINFAKIMEKAV